MNYRRWTLHQNPRLNWAALGTGLALGGAREINLPHLSSEGSWECRGIVIEAHHAPLVETGKV